jgi:[acyl-carrier-protein] S-malonyltransferase
MRETVAIVCPGRGTYTKAELGYLEKHRPWIDPWLGRLDQRLKAQGQPSVSDLDGASQFSLKTHTPGEYASTLIYACSFADFLAIDRERFEVVCVTGNSMGWYTALSVAGALDENGSFDVIHTMGSMMQGGVIGGQVIYPTTGPDWQPDPAKLTAVEAILAKARQTPGAELYHSILFGGYAILGGNKAGLDLAMATLPSAEEGRYPFQLINHAAFHTPLLRDVAHRGQVKLGVDLFQRPALPMVDGRGAIWQPYSTDPADLRAYTLGHQVVETYDFTRAIEVTLKEFAPDRLILLGPGATSGGAIGQILVKNRWWGLADKDAFARRQAEDPLLLAMGRADQYARVCKI